MDISQQREIGWAWVEKPVDDFAENFRCPCCRCVCEWEGGSVGHALHPIFVFENVAVVDDQDTSS